MNSVDFQKWAVDLSGLLDEIESALDSDDAESARKLVHGRFAIAENNGLEIEKTGIPLLNSTSKH